MSKRRNRHLLARVLVPALLASLAGGYIWLRAGPATPEPERETIRVLRETLDRTVSATGVIRPMVGAEIDVGSRVSGIVHSIPVNVGASVGRGDLLARIDPTEFQAQLAEARADLALAEAQQAMALNAPGRQARGSGPGPEGDGEPDRRSTGTGTVAFPERPVRGPARRSRRTGRRGGCRLRRSRAGGRMGLHRKHGDPRRPGPDEAAGPEPDRQRDQVFSPGQAGPLRSNWTRRPTR